MAVDVFQHCLLGFLLGFFTSALDLGRAGASSFTFGAILVKRVAPSDLNVKEKLSFPFGSLFYAEADEKATFIKSHLAEKYKLCIWICFCFCLRTHKGIVLLLFLRNVPDTVFPCCRSDSTPLC